MAVVKLLDKLLDRIILVCVILALLYASLVLYDTTMVYVDAKAVVKDTRTVEEFKATNPDIVAMLEIPDTGIKYPVLQGRDNLEYLNRDADGNDSLSGSIFIDANNSPDFSDDFTLFYGHRMSAGAMFGNIGKFLEKDYFDAHPTGLLTLTDGREFTIHFYACMEAGASTKLLFDVGFANQHIDELDALVASDAAQSRIKISGNRIALSTCETATTTGRILLFGTLAPKN